jgi:hypothetical protein
MMFGADQLGLKCLDTRSARRPFLRPHRGCWRDLVGSASDAAVGTALNLKTGDALPVEGFLPLRKFFLGEQIAVVGFAPAKCPAANRDHDPGFFPSVPPCQTGWRDDQNFLLGQFNPALRNGFFFSIKRLNLIKWLQKY